jgi:PPM family protein phosphatase
VNAGSASKRVPQVSSLQLAAAGPGQDRVRYSYRDGVLLAAVAGGAGGSSGGLKAAEIAVALAMDAPAVPQNCGACTDLMLKIDRVVYEDTAAGESTLVFAVIRDQLLHGACVGDSIAWIVRSSEVQDLTSGAARKPLLGSGGALPYCFGPIHMEQGILLLATDGLWKYAPREQIARCAASLRLPCALDELADLVRLRSGSLQDDVAIAAVQCG